jgi:hypothetical protein
MKLYNINLRIAYLEEHLTLALAGIAKRFNEISLLKKQGLYIIFKKDEIIYIGKTGRNGKTRLRELTSDYRSHTFNKKLLQEHFEIRLGYILPKFNKKTKSTLVSQEVLTLEQFIEGQQSVNNYIKSQLEFKFYEFENNDLESLEHFAISIFNPKYND